ncbi:MAG: hypothetical protein DRR08_24695 [Candidatus Parabeggiatoa sp. nov. 2]|nr:MAG: hypothetical protein B6247_21605 [Beggiatoa sp. 4572_84]RKZ55307.1 MAG: hypothetical protein DRR08_24695 [Gammaproteobacteria bacterium]HEC83743.1 hypothetical protein [Thioploca sp.]
MKKIVVILTFMVLSACETPPHHQGGDSSVSKQTTSTSSYRNWPSSPKLNFPSSSFDDDLSKAMRGQTEQIEVSLAKSVDPDKGEIPEQLIQWLAAIEDSGGKIDYEPLGGDMSVIGAIALLHFTLQALEMIGEWYQEYQEEKTTKYAVAEKYNARLCYRRDDNLVTKIVFVARNKSDPEKPFCPREGN